MKIISLFVILFFCVCTLIEAVCPLQSSSSRNGTFSKYDAARLFSGFNSVWGPIITSLPLNDPAAMQMMKMMHVGATRFPGGTVANYWSLKNGNYTTPCNNTFLNRDWCTFANQIANESFLFLITRRFLFLITRRFLFLITRIIHVQTKRLHERHRLFVPRQLRSN